MRAVTFLLSRNHFDVPHTIPTVDDPQQFPHVTNVVDATRQIVRVCVQCSLDKGELDVNVVELPVEKARPTIREEIVCVTLRVD